MFQVRVSRQMSALADTRELLMLAAMHDPARRMTKQHSEEA
jgi:hypothetical protein